jgi:hypothetical protein
MIAKFTDKKRKILRRVYGALSLTTALFVFQACYGTDKDFGADVYIKGFVKSKTTNLPIQGIKVSIDKQFQYEITDSTGAFSIYASYASEYNIKFEDSDSIMHGLFMSKDTILKIVDKETYLNVLLNDK